VQYYTAGAGLAALVFFVMMIKKGRTSGVWAFALVACSFVIGTAPIINGILPGLINWAANLVSQAVFQQSIETGAVYSGAVVVICVGLLVWWLKDGHVSPGEKWGMVICSFVVGSTPLVTSWFPTALNEVWSMIPV
jgi:hypothetical protein